MSSRGCQWLRMALAVVAGFAVPCAWGQHYSTGEAYVGKAGDEFISESEFLQRFEMLPSLYRHRKSRIEESKLEFLYSMISEKLLAQEAEDRGLGKDSLLQIAMREIAALLARDQLYREEVSSQVKVTSEELNEGVAQARQQILVSFVCFEREDDAHFVRNQVSTAKDLEHLQIDSTMRAVWDTATVIWGDADPAVEAAVYALKHGEVSPVVVAGRGFYIFGHRKVVSSSFYAGMQPQVLRERVAERIRRRKESARASEFVEELMRGKVGYSIPGPFTRLARTMMDVFREERRDSLVTLTGERAKSIRAMFGKDVAETLAVAGTTSWTVDEVIARLFTRRFALPRDDVRNMPPRLNAEIKLMVYQELLEQEAVQRSLANAPEVHQQLEMWRSAYLADLMKAYVADHVSVSDPEVYVYLKSRGRQESIPRVHLRELKTKTLDEMGSALGDLEAGMPWEMVINKWSSDTVNRDSGGITPPFGVNERYPLGEIAGAMKVGERYGPLRVEDDVLYFELLKKESFRASDDTSFAVARRELLMLKQRRALNLFLAQTGQDRGFSVFQDRLSKLSVSPIPMMTFRFLGFGGRMMAVPFVKPLIDWLEIEPPATRVIP